MIRRQAFWYYILKGLFSRNRRLPENLIRLRRNNFHMELEVPNTVPGANGVDAYQ